MTPYVPFSRHLVSTLLAALAALCLASAPAHAQSDDGDAQTPQVRFVTSHGEFVLELRPDVAPETVENFLQYAREGFYDGTVFHRVIPGFMIQGGGFTPELSRKPTRDPIVNEATADLPNQRGTIAMARTSNPDSATSQFFINVVDNDFLNDGVRGPGYAVFGKVTDGMDVVDAIAGVETGYARGMRDVPVEPVVIEQVSVIGNDE
ncbi:MAG: peptidyl-prolyl cis-trans isomerase [Marinobacter sp.]|nr:peptidyl-prolyl cis-trans isomerase [Marinobacter sp.]